MRLLFVNHTPYDLFWKPLIEKFDGFAVSQLEIYPYWELSGQFNAWENQLLESNEPLIVVAHSFGCLFLPEIAKWKSKQGKFSSVWIEPRFQPLLGASENAASEIRECDSDVILENLARPLEAFRGEHLDLRSDLLNLDNYIQSFSESPNFTKALMIEHAKLSSTWNHTLQRSWSWKPVLQLRSENPPVEFAPWGSLGSDVHSLEYPCLLPFVDRAVIPMMNSIERFYAINCQRGLENTSG